MKVAINPNQTLQIMVPAGGRAIQCEARVLWTGDDIIETSFPTRHKVRVPVQVDYVDVTVPRDDGAYTMRCPIILVSRDGLALHKPSEKEIQRLQRRESVRMRTEINCWLTPKGSPAVRGRILDLSMGGCLAEVPEAFTVGSLVTVTAQVDEGMLIVEGEVRRCNFTGGEDGLRQRVGIEFGVLGESSSTLLRKTMYRLQHLYVQKERMAREAMATYESHGGNSRSPVLVDSFLEEVAQEMARLAPAAGA